MGKLSRQRNESVVCSGNSGLVRYDWSIMTLMRKEGEKVDR